ncbi:unnamed protein product [Pseudo-nitzschia multistriata]|uniref:RING-type domain-containing protein n=1 Tax=Pseudo-nitzschia multistriata TaxID=183589 RepID=A0A448YWE8_9STRA|nr:unnamed protein product [Pseudo-nitzschia multistriata]
MTDQEMSQSSEITTGEIELQASGVASNPTQPPGNPERLEMLFIPANRSPENPPSNSGARNHLLDHSSIAQSHHSARRALVFSTNVNGTGAHDTGTRSQAPNIAASQSQSSPRHIARCETCCIRTFRNFIFFLTYPCVLLITMCCLLAVLIFCVVPTMICMIIVTCLYYCLANDPVPVSSLVRHIFIGEEADNSWYVRGGLYPNGNDRDGAEVNRELFQSKLVVRELLQVKKHASSPEYGDADNIGAIDDGHTHERYDSNSKLHAGEESGGNAKKNEMNRRGLLDSRFSRCHPFPIQILTEGKLYRFSEPLKAQMKDDNTDKSIRALKEGEAGTSDDIESGLPNHVGEDNDASSSLCFQRTAENQLSNRNLREIFPRNNVDTHLERNRSECNIQDDTVPDADDTENHGVCARIKNNHFGEDTDTLHLRCNEADDNSNKIGVDPKRQEEAYGCDPDESMRDRGAMCDICLLEFEAGDEVAWSPNLKCSHTFHKECILDWLVRKQTCPTCRQDYLKGNTDDDKE